MSSRRVPKGPGRRPIAEGTGVRGTAAGGVVIEWGPREFGIWKSTGHIWKNGTVVRRKDGSGKVVRPLVPLPISTISPRFLFEEERTQIADIVSQGHGPTAVGKSSGRSPSTISRELRRNPHTSGQYRPFHTPRRCCSQTTQFRR